MMSKLKISILLPVALVVVVILCSCSEPRKFPSLTVESIPYEGSQDQAQLTSTNAELLATGAYLGGDVGSSGAVALGTESSPGQGGSGSNEVSGAIQFSRIFHTLERTVEEYLLRSKDGPAVVPLANYDVGWDETGYCTGEYTVSGMVDVHSQSDGTESYVLIIDYQDFSDDCESYISGKVEARGVVNLNTGVLDTAKLRFGPLEVSGPGQDWSLSGYWSWDGTVYPYTEQMDYVLRDDDSGSTFFINNYLVLRSYGTDSYGDYLDIAISGRYYHPVHGYTDFTCPENLRFYNDDEWPSSGEMLLEGSGNSAALMNIPETLFYEVFCDEDGDGQHDEFDSGTVRWYLANPGPVAVAGDDFYAMGGLLIELDGSQSSDPEGETLTYSWQIISMPAASYGYIQDPAAVSPSLIADVEGDYTIRLIVWDEIGKAAMDEVVVYVKPYCRYSAQSLVVTDVPTGTRIGDFNSDGLNDVVVTTSSGILMFLQDENGFLGTPTSYQIGEISSLEVGDFNTDGRLDVVGVGNGSILMMIQNDAGTLEIKAPIATTQSYIKNIGVGDINGDGTDDVVVCSYNVLDVYYLDSSGNVQAHLVLDVDAQGGVVVLEDVTGEGLTDIVVLSTSGLHPDLSVFAQNGYGTLDSPAGYEISSVWLPGSVSAGDINGDGLNEVLVACHTGVSVFSQADGGLVESSIIVDQYGDSPEQVKVADVNGDGRQDLITKLFMGFNSIVRVKVDYQAADGALTEYAYFSLDRWAESPFDGGNTGVSVGDVNSDGRIDIVGCNNYSDENYSYGLILLLQNPPPIAGQW